MRQDVKHTLWLSSAHTNTLPRPMCKCAESAENSRTPECFGLKQQRYARRGNCVAGGWYTQECFHLLVSELYIAYAARSLCIYVDESLCVWHRIKKPRKSWECICAGNRVFYRTRSNRIRINSLVYQNHKQLDHSLYTALSGYSRCDWILGLPCGFGNSLYVCQKYVLNNLSPFG